MKKIISFCILAALLITVGTANGQNVYHPFTDGCSWSVSNEKYMTAGDTVLDGITYLKIYRQVGSQEFEFNLEEAEYFAAIRNDSAQKKVYCYLPAGTWVYDQFNQLTIIDTGMDVTLYDFTPQLGESFLYYTICPTSHVAQEVLACRSETAYVTEGYDYENVYYTVYEDSDSLITMSDGSTRRRILLYITWGVNNYFNDVWIEGIGRLEGFNDIAAFDTETPLRMLLCYHDNTGAFYQTGYDFDGSDDCFNNNGHGTFSIPENSFGHISVYPNPVDNVLHIDGFPLHDYSMLYEIVDEMGKCLVSEKIYDEKAAVNLKSFSPGIYFLKLEMKGQTSVHKIIKL